MFLVIDNNLVRLISVLFILTCKVYNKQSALFNAHDLQSNTAPVAGMIEYDEPDGNYQTNYPHIHPPISWKNAPLPIRLKINVLHSHTDIHSKGILHVEIGILKSQPQQSHHI